MHNFSGSFRSVRRIATLAPAVLLVLLATVLNAETVKTVNGVDIDSSIFDFYVVSRAQRPAEQVTAEERAALLDELTDIYLLSSGEAADKVADDPQLKAQLELQRRGLIAQTLAGKFFEGIKVTEEEILAAYDAQAALAPPLQFKARHILVESQGEAMSVIAELDIGGDFETLAKERSTGPSGSNGGDLGWFSPNQMVAAFSDAVAELEDGKYTTQPVQTEFGWHVILRDESRKAEAPTLDSVREVIIQNVQQEKFKVYLDSLRSENQS
jgi:peptidyl-prolyl cis-trans isomerase C